jgi:hypothetical protein
MNNPELYEAITEHWGERCSEYDPGCFCCRAWDQFDAVAELQKRLAEEKHQAELQTPLRGLFPDGLIGIYLEDGSFFKIREGEVLELRQQVSSLQAKLAEAERAFLSKGSTTSGVWERFCKMALSQRNEWAEKAKAAEAKLAAVRERIGWIAQEAIEKGYYVDAVQKIHDLVRGANA